MREQGLVLFAASAHAALGQEIAALTGVSPGKATLAKWSDDALLEFHWTHR